MTISYIETVRMPTLIHNMVSVKTLVYITSNQIWYAVMIHGKWTPSFWPSWSVADMSQNMGTYIRLFLVDGYANEQPAHTWQIHKYETTDSVRFSLTQG